MTARRADAVLVVLALCGCGPHAATSPATPQVGPSHAAARADSPPPRVTETATRGCDDPRLTRLVLGFRRAVATADGTALQRVTSPVRGLSLQQDETNIAVVIAWTDLASIFVSQAPRAWGENDMSEEPVVGSFRAQMLPTLQRAVGGPGNQAVCGSLLTGGSAATYAWPEGFAALTPVSLYVPSTDGTNDWVTWAAGVEYLDEKPYVVALVRYQYEI